MKNLHLPFWIAGSAALCLLAIAKPASSQVTLDGSTLTTVSSPGCASNCTISDGTVSSPNQFHSFSQFSVPVGVTATFSAFDTTIQNIIVRVTGSSVSDIQGKIASPDPVSLFLINPNGIIFGSNASLDLQGSFIGTTASAIKFADGTEFSATNTAAPPLTSSIPSSLEFRGVAGSIVNRSQDLGLTNSIGSPSGLQVLNGYTLALVGGDVSLENGNLYADGGRIELGSVAGTGSVGLSQVTKGWALDYSGIKTPNAAGNLFGNIKVSDNSFVDAGDFFTGLGSGEIQVRANSLTLENSAIASTNYGTQTGGDMTINASTVNANGTIFVNGSPAAPAGLGTQTKGTGAAGNVTINTGSLSVLNGAQVSTSSLADGNGGNLTVNASQSIILSGLNPDVMNGNSGLFTSTGGSGTAGNLTITTKQLSIQNQAQISSSTGGTGNAGNISINATDSTQITGIGSTDTFTGVFAQSSQSATGLPANITIATGKLIQRDGAFISTQSNSSGRGNITINAPQIQMFNGSVISADSFGTATGGTITITTDTIFGTGNSDIVSGAANNRGGQIVINAQGIFGLQKRDKLTPGNDIVTDSALGTQFNGPITLNTPDIDPLRGLIEQPKIPAPGKVASGCDASGAIASNPNYFIQPGKGGLSPTPTDLISSWAIWDDMRSMNISNSDRSPAVALQATSSRRSQKEIRVAQGWKLKEGSRDTVVLVPDPANVVANTNVQAAVACHNSRS